MENNEDKFFREMGKFMNNDISYTKDVISNMDKKEKSKYYAGKFVKYINKLSQNIFIQSMMRGFMMVIPLLIVGGVFSLIMSVPENLVNAFRDSMAEKWTLPIWLKQICQKVFNLTFGLAGILSCLCITYEMTIQINRQMRESRQIYPIVTVVAAFSCYMIFLVGNVYANGEEVNFTSISLTMLGTLGMLPGLIIALFVPYVYKWCYKHNWIIRLPKIVPEAVLLSVIVLIPLFFSVLIYLLPSWLIFHFTGKGVFEWMNEKALEGVYESSNSFWFYLIYQQISALCYFTGIHNSIISNVFESVRQVNVHGNFTDLVNGVKPNNIFVGATSTNMIGGLGSLAMVPIAILLFTKSKQIKSIGQVALIACLFNLPEPVLFGLPVILNPVLLLPMLLAPALNATVEWLFVMEWGMTAPYVDVAWCLPWFLVLPVATGLDGLSFLAMIICLGVSFAVWSPFVVIQDKILLKGERTSGQIEEGFHDDRTGIKVMWDYCFKHTYSKEVKVKVLEQRELTKANTVENDRITYKNSISVNQAKAKFNVTKLNKKVCLNNILIISNDEKEAKELGLSIVRGMDEKSNLNLFIKAINDKKLKQAEKESKLAQLVFITESSKNIYEDIDIITRNRNHILYPLTEEEAKDYIVNSKKIFKLVEELTVQKNKE